MDENLTQLGLVDDEAILLDDSALSLAALDHPDTDLTPFKQILTDIASGLEAVAADATTAHARADALSLVINGEFGFTGDRKTYDDPANADLLQVIDRRRGLPISLSILYVAAARRMGWLANVLDLPGHVLILVGDEEESLLIDPFNDGALIRPEQLAALLSHGSRRPEDGAFKVAAMPNRAVLVRLLLNQAIRAEQTGDAARALEVYRRITDVAPGNGHAWWQRARLELSERDIDGARKSLTAMLEVTRQPELRDRINETLAALVAS